MEYCFQNKKTKKLKIVEMKISEYDEFVKNNPQLVRYHDTVPAIAGSRGGDLDGKTDNTWKEVLAKIGEQNPRSPLADRYRRKSIKEIKTNQILEKHAKLQRQGKK